MIQQNIFKHISRLLLLTIVGGMVLACKEDVDTSNRYTFTDETVLSYLEKHSEYSEYTNLINTVPVSNHSQSTVAQLLSARGHYTVFAPNNNAIQLYLDSLQRKGEIQTASWDGFPDERTLDSIQKVIVYNSIIDGGNRVTYETGNFPTNNNDEFRTRTRRVPRNKLNGLLIFAISAFTISPQWS